MGPPLKQGMVSHAKVVESHFVAALRSSDLGGGGVPVGASVIQVAVCIAKGVCEAAVDVELCDSRIWAVFSVTAIKVGCWW